MIILRTIASHPDIAFMASVIAVVVIAAVRSFVGFGADVPRFGDE